MRNVGLKDSIVRFDSYNNGKEENKDEKNEYTNFHFLNHALFLLTDVDDGSNLQNILNVFRQDDDFIMFWFPDFLFDHNSYFIKFGYNKLNELREFIIEPNVSGESKSLIIHSISNIAAIDASKKEKVLEFIYSVLKYFHENRNNKELLDTKPLLQIITSFIDMGYHQGDDIIKSFFEMDIIPHNYSGNYEEIIKKIDKRDNKIRPNEYVNYEQFLSNRSNESFDSDNNLNDLFGKDHFKSKKKPILPVKTKKTGRNEPCPCGSGKEFKKCCMNK